MKTHLLGKALTVIVLLTTLLTLPLPAVAHPLSRRHAPAEPPPPEEAGDTPDRRAPRQQVAEQESDPEPEALQESAWFAQAVAHIEATEYHVSRHDDAWSAPNRAHNLRTRFTGEGLRLTPRLQRAPAPDNPTGRMTLELPSRLATGSWEWSLELRGVGRGDEILRIESAPQIASAENRIEYRHELPPSASAARIVEWYVNDERGLEQGFTLDAPLISPRSAPLVLELATGGDLMTLPSGNDAIDLVADDGTTVLRYGHLHAYDLTGRALPATLELHAAASTLHLVVDDGQAIYPITIDPLLYSPWATDPADTSSARLGYAVSSVGDLNGDGYDDLAIGAPGYNSDQGQLWIYHGSAAGPSNALNIDPDWEAGPTGQDDAHFGMAVAGAGDVNNDGYDDVLIGAPDFDAGQSGEGRVYLYLGSVTGLETTPAWSADPADQTDAGFGHAVTGVGDVDGDGYDDWLVSAPRYANEGSAYLYRGAASLSGLSAAWIVSPTGQTDALFGWTVASPGDVNGDGRPDVAVGAPYFDGSQTDEGRVYLFLSNTGGVPNTTPDWSADPVDQASAHFGDGLASAGDVNCDGKADLIAGAPGFDNENTDEGAVYVYFGTGGGLSATPDWEVDPTDQDDAHFGTTVSPIATGACDGVVAGAPDYDNPNISWSNGEGIVYAFPVYTTTLNSARYCTSMGLTSLSHWGRALAPAGDVDNNGTDELLVSLDRYDVMYAVSTAGASEAVNLVTYTGYPWCQFSSREGLQPIDVQDLSAVGYAAAGVGDVNGDGYADVILGAPNHDGSSSSNEGHAYVYYGSPHGLIPTYSVTTDGMGNVIARTITEDRNVITGTVGDRFGAALAPAGDVNDDGYDDLIVGAPGYDGENTDEGRAYLYYGTPSGLTWSPVWSADPADTDGAHFGRAVGGAGDVNGDQHSDLVVGAPTLTTTLAAEGRAYVYHGSADGPGSSADWTLDPVDEAYAHFGTAVSAAGDVDNDGYADLIVGAPGANGGLTDQGAAYVYRGSATGLDSSAWWSGSGGRAGAHFGFAVGTAGDVNGDDHADWIVGAPDDGAVALNQGRADLYLGGGAPPAAVSWTGRPTGTQSSLYFGQTVGTAGDVDGDGYGDLIVGGWGYVGYAHEGTDVVEGRAYVYHGSASGLASAPDWATDPTNQNGAEFGFAAAAAGDVDGDGYADVIAGAPGYTRDVTEGRAYVYFGTEHGLEADIEPDWRADPSTVTNERNGYAVDSAGDVNGDGYADVVIAAYNEGGMAPGGHVYVYHGSSTGVSAPGSPDWDRASPGSNSYWFARSVSTAGDINNDGYDDLLVGNPDYIHTPAEVYTGAVHIYLGSATGLSATLTITEPSSTNTARSWFGQTVANAGDVDNDGYDDLVVGAPYASPSGNSEGMAFVYYGDASGIHAQYSPMDTTDEAGAGFGYAVSTAGDINGDGYADVLVGAPYKDSFDSDKGIIYLYYGSSTGVNLTSDWADSPDASQSWYKVGSSVSAAGDIDGDGYADVVTGGRGVVLVYYGSTTGLDNWDGPDWIMTSSHLDITSSSESWPVSAGDFNGDGYADVLVGIPDYAGQNAGEGAALIYYGTTCGGLGSPTAPDWIADPAESDYARFGAAVAAAGDVNGDGVDDVIAGAPGYDTDVGRAYLFHGVQAPPLAALSVSKWDDPDPVATGALLTYTVVVSNYCATTTATNVLLTDTLPLEVDPHTVTTTQGLCNTASNVIGCTLGDLANGSVATVTLVVTPTLPGAVTNTVTVSADQEERTLSDNSDRATTQVFVDPCETILLKPFEGGGTTPPSGWSVVDNQGNGQVWRFDNPRARWNQTGGSGGFAIVDSDYYGENGAQDTELHTPSLDFSAASSGTLEFDTYFWRGSSEIADVDVSDDGGATWTNVWRKTSTYGNPAHESLDLTTLAGASSAQIRFHYYNASYGWYWEVDNVKIRRCASPYGVSIAPPSLTRRSNAGATVTYTLQVTNTGSVPDTYSVTVGGNSWPTQAPATLGPLAVGGSSPLTVTVSIPAAAAPGSSDGATLTVTSQGDGTVSASSLLTTTVNRPPVGVAESYVVTKGTTLQVTAPGLLANDSDPEGDPLTLQLQGNVSHGSLAIGTDGAFSYTPNGGYIGDDAFTYKAYDGRALSDLVTVTLVITNHAPVALADSYVVTKGTTLNVAAPGLLTNDSDPEGDPLIVHLQGNVSHGSLAIGTDGAFSYTPNAGYTGSDAFTYKAYDGFTHSNLVTATLTISNHVPVARADSYVITRETTLVVAAPGLLANDSDGDQDPLTTHLLSNVSHGTLAIGTDGAFSYTPDAGYTGSDAFTYRAYDDYAYSSPATATLEVISPYGAIGDRVWRDSDMDGIQDPGESGLPSVTVRLFTAAGVLSGTTSTNASGNYSFTDLLPGDYYLHVVLPADHRFSPRDQSGFDVDDSDIDPNTGRTVTTTLTANEYDASWDAGLYRLATVGDRVWNDTNYDGAQSAGESGVPGVTVTLYVSGTTTTLTHTLTGAGGHYSFTLLPGDYYLRFARPAGHIFTHRDATGEDQDSDVGSGGNSPPFSLGEGEQTLDWDAGLVETAAVGDLVWHDIDKDGIQDSEELGLAGVTVHLYNSGGIAAPATTTDADGHYTFTNLVPGSYYVKVLPPANWDFSPKDNPAATDDKDSDFDPADGETDYFALAPGARNATLDAGIYPRPAAVGDRVWHDADTDGIQGSGEGGYFGVRVNLYLAGGAAPLDSTTTDLGGTYLFRDLLPGHYFIEYEAPSGWLFSPRDLRSDDGLDSDADRTTGRTAVFTLTAGITATIWDAGLYQYRAQSVITPGIGNLLTYTDTQGNETQVHVPGGAVSHTTDLFYSPFSLPGTPGQLQSAALAEPLFARHAFRLDVKQQGLLLQELTFDEALSLTVTYSDADVEGLEEETLHLYHWDVITWGWVDATRTCGPESPQHLEPEHDRISTAVCTAGRYALFGTGADFRIYLPLVIRND